MARKTRVDVVTENLAHTSDEFEIPAFGDVAHEDGVIESVTEPIMSDHTQQLLFMEDPITIQLHDPQDNNPEPVVPVGVNGKVLYLQRGQQHTIARKFVEVLARARRVNYTTQDAVTPDGSRTMVLRSATTLQYPFTVIHDPAGAVGIEWLRAIMNERV